jgi:23S rRNA pseudoU1915 N3-methylase RlmH
MFVAPALELIMLDKALNNKFDRERARLLFGEMYATALAGDGTVGRRRVELTVGGELGGGAALLRLAALLLLNQVLSDKLKFGMRAYVGEGRYYRIAAYGENAAKLMCLLAVTAPSAGGEYLSDKFNEFAKEARVEVRFDNIRRTKSGLVAADLIISEASIAVKYNVYLRNAIELEFRSTDWGRVELAARLLKLAGVGAEVKKEEVDVRDVWYVRVTTNMLAAGREELRKALAGFVRKAVENGWVDAGKAERWLEELEKGRVVREGWPEYYVGLTRSGALVVRYHSTDPDSIKQEVQRLKEMELEEGRHFSVKMPEGGKAGYVYILKEGLAYAAWLSESGKGEQRKLAAEFVEYILRRAEKAGKEVYEKVREIIEEGKTRGSLTLKGLEKEVEVDGRRHVVKVIGGGAELEESQSGKKLLRIRITAEIDGVRREYTITYGRYGTNAAVGFATAKADAPDGREADAERLAAVIKALTGKEPRIHRMKDGTIMIVCGREHLDGFKRFAELADVIERWLEETGR